MGNLLSIDWDFFFPIPEIDREFLYDWGHREDFAFMLDGIWDIRAAAFLGRKKPLPDTNGEEKTFWDRFTFAPNTKLYFADSHSQAVSPKVSKDISIVWNFDAHHDAYTSIAEVIKKMKVDCGSWMIAYHLHLAKLKVVYPAWKHWAKEYEKPYIPSLRISIDKGKRVPLVFDKIFLCRSGAWTPTWIEDKFWKFIEDCPVKEKVVLDSMKPRVYDEDKAVEIMKQTRILMKEVESGRRT